jgi:hypothetical protein
MSGAAAWLDGVTERERRPTGRSTQVEQEREGAVTTTLTASSLTASDRCDRCGAQAYVRVTLVSGSELLFCAHHAREYQPRLRELEARIEDETVRLEDTPAVASLDER